MRVVGVALVATATLAAGCGSSGDGRAAAAFCVDYRAARAMADDPAGGPDAGFFVDWIDRRDDRNGFIAAQLAFDHASASCPEVLDDIGFRNFLSLWLVDTGD